ncbi:MAG TPA: YaiI/YqxD family protein [Myxococcota bacterium]|nr:YaiI/YqxD family protein [Myxococcota bacterium]HRY93403.1 YaiI/YqxD family protein [Myxococcota bacterium]HSA23434.1 YaiI/YqxD family protein [Myxococcota bacterium]
MLDLYVDADACPVKAEIYRVAQRYGLRVVVVSATPLQTPRDGRVECVVVGRGEGVADDWIAERIGALDVCVTADIPLAARCLARGARALGPRGKEFSPDAIGELLATRDLLATLRGAGQVGGGPPPFTKADRSEFLNQLDRVLQALRREAGRG